MKELIPKKSLGQHFLRSEKALNQIVDTTISKVVFEIGPGEGVLTEKLLAKNFTVIVVEIDKRSIEILNEKFAKEISNKKLFILEQDCLETNYGEVLKNLKLGHEYYLLGNIPYYITGAIFRTTFEQKLLPVGVTFLIQKEVATRILARDKKESILSVSIKIFTNEKSVEIVDIVKAGSFVPPPKVDSAILNINNIFSPFKNENQYNIFFKILKAAFSHKRKFLLTNLKTDLDKIIYEKYIKEISEIIIKINGEKARGEDVNLETWREIINIL